MHKNVARWVRWTGRKSTSRTEFRLDSWVGDVQDPAFDVEVSRDVVGDPLRNVPDEIPDQLVVRKFIHAPGDVVRILNHRRPRLGPYSWSERSPPQFQLTDSIFLLLSGDEVSIDDLDGPEL